MLFPCMLYEFVKRITRDIDIAAAHFAHIDVMNYKCIFLTFAPMYESDDAIAIKSR